MDGTERGAAHSEDSRRYIRVNPDIGRSPPRLDAVGEIELLQSDVARYLKEPEATTKLEDIVFRLVASSFYFERTHATRDMSRGTAKVRGKLQCRFEESSEWAKEMGLFFKKHQRADFQPYFDTWDGVQQHSRDKINFDSSRIERMASHGELNVQEIELTVATSGRDALIRLHLHTSSGRTKGYPISGFPRDFFKEIEGVEVDTEEIEETPEDRVSKSVSLRGIPSINTLSRNGTALLRPGAPGSTSEKNLSTQPHGLNEDDRRKSDEVVARATPEKASLALSLKAKFSKLSLRDDEKRPQQPEMRHRSMEIPSKGIRRDRSLDTHEREQQASRNSSRHRRSFSTNSPPEQPQREREMASLPITTHETGQHKGGYDTPYAAPDTNPRSFSSNPIPRMSMPQLNPTPLPMSNPQWQAIHPTRTSQPPLAPATIPSGFTTTAAPSSTYEYYCADNAYSSPHTAAAQLRTQHTTSTFDDTLGAPAQPGHTATRSPPSNNPYHQPPPYEANEKADLELEFAVQISLAEQEEEQREQQRRLRRALEESQRDAYWY